MHPALILSFIPSLVYVCVYFTQPLKTPYIHVHWTLVVSLFMMHMSLLLTVELLAHTRL